MIRKALRQLCGGFVFWTLLSACGNGEGQEDGNRVRGPIMSTLPIAEGMEEQVTLDGETVTVRAAKEWDTEEVRVELLGTQSLLHISIAEELREDWRRYMEALDGQRFVVRIKDVDLMIMDARSALKPEGMWSIGPRQTAEPRAQELLRRMSERD